MSYLSRFSSRLSRQPARPGAAPIVDAAAAVQPLRALLSPLWLGALATLVLNDHVLKQSGALPGVVTGKLSDFAGLIVAPVLFAALLRVRSRSGLALAYAAVAVVFSAIQLSAPFAAAWSSAMGWVGMPWAITMDPTDLVALAAMPLAWHAFAPLVQSNDVHVATLAARSARIGAIGGGLVACVATSPPPPIDEFYNDIFASAYLHNASDNEVRLLLRPLRSEVEVDCTAISSDPGALLPDSAFGQGVLWALPPRTTIAANEQPAGPGCRAVHVSGDSITPMIMFWDGELEQRFVVGQILEGVAAPAWGVSLNFEADGSPMGAVDTGPQLHFDIKAPPSGSECTNPDEALRLDWVGIPSGNHVLSSVEVGLDGCMRLGFDDSGETSASYLCMPVEMFAFQAGDAVTVSQVQQEWISIKDAEASLPRELHVARRDSNGGLSGIETATRPMQACGLSVDPDCAVVQAPAELLVVGAEGSATLSLDAPSVTLPYDEGRSMNLQLVFAAERALVDTSCANGSLKLGGDAEFVAVISPVAAP